MEPDAPYETTLATVAAGRAAPVAHGMRMAGGEKPYFDHLVPASTLEPGGRD